METTEQAPVRVVGLGGSLSYNSASLAALKIALSGAEEAGVETVLLDVRELDLPMYRPELEETLPPAAVYLNETVYSAHGLIWSSPLYHGSISGSFKNALDWLNPLKERDPVLLTGKVVGLIAVAGGTFGLQAVNTMEFIVRAMRAYAVPLVLPIARSWKVFDDQGQIQKQQIEMDLLNLGREVGRDARLVADSGESDYALLTKVRSDR